MSCILRWFSLVGLLWGRILICCSWYLEHLLGIACLTCDLVGFGLGVLVCG